MTKKIGKYAAWIAGGLALVGALAMMRAPGQVRGLDIDGFVRLPVLEGGRLKPLDSTARNALLVIRGQQSFRHQDRTVGSGEWILDVLFRPQVADLQPIFVIDSPDVLGIMKLERTKERYYSFRQIIPFIDEIQREASAAQAIEAKLRTPYQSAVANLFERLYLYHRLKNTIQLENRPGSPPRSPAPPHRPRRSARASSPTWPTSAPSRRCPARGPRPGPTPARPCAAWPWAR